MFECLLWDHLAKFVVGFKAGAQPRHFPNRRSLAKS